MGMNVQGMNNVAMKSAMVGFVPNQKLAEVKKEQEHSTTVREMKEQDTSNSSKKSGGDDPNSSVRSSESRNQQAAQQARRRQVSLPEEHRSSTEEASSGQSSESAETSSGKLLGTTPSGPSLLLDNTARINFQFKAQQRATSAANGDSPQQRPEVQKRQFLTRLRDMVNTEYKQYVKSDTNLYTRRNLREIASALGDTRDPNVDRQRLEDSSVSHREVFGEEYAGFNKFNQMQMTRTQSAMQQYLHEPPQDQLSLVA
jgi:hypothetical protein